MSEQHYGRITSLREDLEIIGLGTQDLTEARTRVQGGKIVKLHKQSAHDRAAARAWERSGAGKASRRKSAKKMAKLARAGKMTKVQKLNMRKMKQTGRLESVEQVGSAITRVIAEHMGRAFEGAEPQDGMQEDLRVLAAGEAAINRSTVAAFANVALLAENLAGQYATLAENFDGHEELVATSDVLKGLAEEAALCARGINVALRENRVSELKLDEVQAQLHEHVQIVTQAAALDVAFDKLCEEIVALGERPVVESNEGAGEDEDSVEESEESEGDELAEGDEGECDCEDPDNCDCEDDEDDEDDEDSGNA